MQIRKWADGSKACGNEINGGIGNGIGKELWKMGNGGAQRGVRNRWSTGGRPGDF
jgi:hypothetical protein